MKQCTKHQVLELIQTRRDIFRYSMRMRHKYLRFLRLLCTFSILNIIIVYDWPPILSQLTVTAQEVALQGHENQYTQFDDSPNSCPDCLDQNYQVNSTQVPEQYILTPTQAALNHNFYPEQANTATLLDVANEEAIHRMLQNHAANMNSSFNSTAGFGRTESGNDAQSKSIYSSLMKILYLMRQQLDKSQAKRTMNDRPVGDSLMFSVADATSVPIFLTANVTNKSPPATVSSALTESKRTRLNEQLGQQSSGAGTLQTISTLSHSVPMFQSPPTISPEPVSIIEVTSEPLADGPMSSYNGAAQVNRPAPVLGNSLREINQWHLPFDQTSISKENVFKSRSDNKDANHHEIKSSQKRPIRYSTKIETPKFKKSNLNQQQNLFVDKFLPLSSNDNLDRPLFTLSTPSSSGSTSSLSSAYTSNNQLEAPQELDGPSLTGIQDNGFVSGELTTKPFDSMTIEENENEDEDDQVAKHSGKPAAGSRIKSATIAPKARLTRNRYHSRQQEGKQSINSNGFQPMRESSYRSKYPKASSSHSSRLTNIDYSPYNEHFKAQPQQLNEEGNEGLYEDHRDRLNGHLTSLSSENYDQSTQRARLSPSDISLRQIFPSPSTGPDYSSYQQPNGQATIYSSSAYGSQKGGTGVYLSNPSGGSQMGSMYKLQSQSQAQQQQQPQPQAVYELSAATSTGQQQQQQQQQQNQQRDLLNQPQTIQITAVPNGAGFANNQNGLLRLNGGVLGLFNNGLVGGLNGFQDPFGRQVVMVNAERRQIDWSFWIWPLLVALALPLILGALFVPVFLKTVVIIIQLLQSLGLLLPITNALSQQITQASGSASGNITNQVEQVPSSDKANV